MAKMTAAELRELLESLPCPFCTDNVTDETLDEISNEVEIEMEDWYDWNKDGVINSDKLDEVWWETLERIVCQHNIPYYEDLD